MSFVAVVASPLLIAHVRNPGGQGGRRITAGRLDGDWALMVATGGGREPSVTPYASESALVHAYNAALRDARRAGLTSRPEPVALTVDALRAAEQAL